MTLVKGKKGLIMGVANDRSIAWGIAKKLSEQKDYKAIVRSLLELKEVIDTFFDKVMVNVDDIELRQTRLKLINRVRNLFLSVADVSYLSS